MTLCCVHGVILHGCHECRPSLNQPYAKMYVVCVTCPSHVRCSFGCVWFFPSYVSYTIHCAELFSAYSVSVESIFVGLGFVKADSRYGVTVWLLTLFFIASNCPMMCPNHTICGPSSCVYPYHWDRLICIFNCLTTKPSNWH